MSQLFYTAIASALLLTAAAPTIANAQATGVNEIVVTGKYQKQWDKGAKLEAESLTKLAAAEKDLTKASSDVLDAQSKRKTADAKAQNASDTFRQMTGSVPYFSSGEEAAKWASKVNDAAKSWAKNADRKDDGGDDMKKAIDKQSKAQSAVNKAQSNVQKARDMKADAERRSQLSAR